MQTSIVAKLLILPALIFSCLSVSSQDSLRQRNHFHPFVPTNFYNSFSLNNSPVLRIQSGDTISTETVDAAGTDKKGVKRQKGGNPLTGPFYIENAKAGDVLAIKLIKVKLNRPSAFTTEYFVSRSLEKSTFKQLPKARLISWKLDLEKNLGTAADSSYPHLQNFSIPLAPFLGCLGVAPSNRKNEILSFFQGPFGGNMDYKEVKEGAIIYLPVFHDGGFLYVGDGHALQGDGEIAGNALETSLDVEFSVSLIGQTQLKLSFPRIENEEYIMAVGTAKEISDALKIATEGLLKWIRDDYQLSMGEASQVMSTTIQYDIAEIADPEIVIVAKIKKEWLKLLKRN